VSAATVPIDAILADEGKLVPARWLENPPGDPAAMLHRIESAERSLLAATATLDQATWTAPRLAAGTSGSERKWTVAKMIDLGLLVRIRPRPVDPDVIGNGGTPFIRAADVGDDFSVTPSEQIDIDLIPPPVELTKPGDVLVTIRGGTSRTAVDQVGGAVASSSIQILRSERDIEPTVLAALVRSAARHYPTVGLTPHVKLAELEIPMLDLAASQQLSQTIQDLGGRRRAAQAAVQAIDELLECLSDGLGSGTLRLEMTLPAGTE
jgi:hypothetical protein